MAVIDPSRSFMITEPYVSFRIANRSFSRGHWFWRS